MDDHAPGSNDGYVVLTPADEPAYAGKTILIGFTHCNRQGKVVDHRQFIGVIETVGQSISVRIDGRERAMTIPPVVQRAASGVYTLRSNGAAIDSPDYLSAWTIYQPNGTWNAKVRRIESVQRAFRRRRTRRLARSR